MFPPLITDGERAVAIVEHAGQGIPDGIEMRLAAKCAGPFTSPVDASRRDTSSWRNATSGFRPEHPGVARPSSWRSPRRRLRAETEAHGMQDDPAIDDIELRRRDCSTGNVCGPSIFGALS